MFNVLTPTDQIPQPSPALPGALDLPGLIKAFTELAKVHGEQNLALQQQGLMAPASRHIGMGGNDITNQQGPYDSGGIDWLKTHNTGAGSQSYFPGEMGRTRAEGMAQGQQNAWNVAQNPSMQSTGAGPLPVTQALLAPNPIMPQGGFSSPQWPAHVQAVQQNLANSMSAIARSRQPQQPYSF